MTVKNDSRSSYDLKPTKNTHSSIEPNMSKTSTGLVGKLVSGLASIFSTSTVSTRKTVRTEERLPATSEYKKPTQPVSTRRSNIPVSVSLQDQIGFIGLFEKLDMTADLKIEDLRELVKELQKPQRIEIKITELCPEDDADLWEIGDSNKYGLRNLIKKSLAKSLGKENFNVESWSFKKGCISIIAVVKIAISVVSTIVTFLNNYDQIKRNAQTFYQDMKVFTREISKVYEKFKSGLVDAINKISDWFNSDGWGFSYG